MNTSKFQLVFFIAAIFASCKTKNKSAPINEIQKTYMDSIQKSSNKIIVSFYADFSKSKINFSVGPITTIPKPDSIFNFVGNDKEDSCNLNISIIPDGHIDFYNDSALIGSLQFVLSGECKGFYSDFSKAPRRYEITSTGTSHLTERKKQLQKDKIIH